MLFSLFYSSLSSYPPLPIAMTSSNTTLTQTKTLNPHSNTKHPAKIQLTPLPPHIGCPSQLTRSFSTNSRMATLQETSTLVPLTNTTGENLNSVSVAT